MTRRHRLLLAALLLLLAVVGARPAAGQTEPPPEAGSEADAAAPGIELVERAPWAQPEDRVPFLVATTGDVSGASVQVEVFSSLDSVEELEASADEDVGVRLSFAPPVPVDALAPGPDGTHEIVVPVAPEPVDDRTTQLVAPGVHPVVISLVDDAGRVLDEIRTPLVRLGEEDDPWDAPDLAVLLDVALPPTLQPDGARAVPDVGLDRLVPVGALLEAHPELDLTVAAVPDTIEALGAVADPAASTLLDRLTGRDLLAMPYVPLPTAALIDIGLEGLLPRLVERGSAVLADRLGTVPRPGVWDGVAEVGDRGGEVLEPLGYDRVVVPAEVDVGDPGEEPEPLADSGPRAVTGTGPLLGVLFDPTLSAELASPSDDRSDAAHVELARLLLRPVEPDPGQDVGDEVGADTTTVLVRPGPLPADSALAGLLELLDRPDAPVRVGGLDLVDDDLDADADAGETGDVLAPELRDLAPRLHAIAAQLDIYAAMIGERSARADDLRLQLATAVAATATAATRQAAITTAEQALGSAFASVRLSGQTDLNLTSRRGTLPVTIENGNGFPVDLQVRIRSDRLAFPEGEVLPVTVEEDVLRIDVPVEALATGSVPVFVELWTPDGQLRLDARQLNVRSTAVSGVGLVISLGALLVLVVWWARHWSATRRGDDDATDDAASVTSGDPMN